MNAEAEQKLWERCKRAEVQVEELTQERERLRLSERAADLAFALEHKRAEQAEAKLAERDRTIKAQDLHRQDLEAKLADAVGFIIILPIFQTAHRSQTSHEPY